MEPSARLVTSVREVAVVHTGDAEHADGVEGHAYSERYPAKARPNYQEASEVDRPERRLLDQVNGMERVTAGVHVHEISPGARSFSRATVGKIVNELPLQAKTTREFSTSTCDRLQRTQAHEIAR